MASEHPTPFQSVSGARASGLRASSLGPSDAEAPERGPHGGVHEPALGVRHLGGDRGQVRQRGLQGGVQPGLEPERTERGHPAWNRIVWIEPVISLDTVRIPASDQARPNDHT